MTNLPITGIFNVTCEYGKKGNLWSSGYHKGIDLVCSNKNIYCTCDGVVKSVGWDAKGWGQYVRVQENTTKKIHIFCHFVKDSVKVKVGQKVSRSTILGTMGTTGNSTGVHLHFQIEKSNTDRTVCDPTEWLKIPNKVGQYNSNNYHIDKPNTQSTTTKVTTKTEDDDMTGEQIYNALMGYLNTLPTSGWAKDASKAGIKSGAFTDGDKDGLVDNPRSFVTREQLAQVLYNKGITK